jgi:PleD family two-component response regulator
MEASAEADPWTVQEQVAEWLRRQIRRADIAGYLGNGRYVVLMPEVPAAGARVVVTRLHQDIRGLDAGLSSYPSDGATFNQLYEAASRRLGKPLKKAA